MNFGAGALVQADSQLKQDARQLRVIVVGDGVACKEGMDAELLGTGGHQLCVSLGHLILTHAVFGVAGVVHDAVAQLEDTARIKTAADGLGDAGDLFQKLYMGQIVEVDVRAQVIRLLHVLHRRFRWRKT